MFALNSFYVAMRIFASGSWVVGCGLHLEIRAVEFNGRKKADQISITLLATPGGSVWSWEVFNEYARKSKGIKLLVFVGAFAGCRSIQRKTKTG